MHYNANVATDGEKEERARLHCSWVLLREHTHDSSFESSVFTLLWPSDYYLTERKHTLVHVRSSSLDWKETMIRTFRRIILRNRLGNIASSD